MWFVMRNIFSYRVGMRIYVKLSYCLDRQKVAKKRRKAARLSTSRNDIGVGTNR